MEIAWFLLNNSSLWLLCVVNLFNRLFYLGCFVVGSVLATLTFFNGSVFLSVNNYLSTESMLGTNGENIKLPTPLYVVTEVHVLGLHHGVAKTWAQSSSAFGGI